MADRLGQDGLSVEVIDLRSLRPLDVDTVVESVRKTNRVLIAEEGWSTFGVGAELAARIQRACFDDLDAPVERVGAAEVPMPYSKPLELAALPLESKIEAAARVACCGSAGCDGGAVAEEMDAPPLRHDGGGPVGRWLKREGDSVQEGDMIAEIETDKATMSSRPTTSTTSSASSSTTARRALGAPIAIVGEAGETVEAPAEEPAEPEPEPETTGSDAVSAETARQQRGTARPRCCA